MAFIVERCRYIVARLAILILLPLSQFSWGANIDFPISVDLAPGNLSILGIKLNQLGNEVIVYPSADINMQIFWAHEEAPPPAIFFGVNNTSQSCFVAERSQAQPPFESTFVSLKAPTEPGIYPIQIIGRNNNSLLDCEDTVDFTNETSDSIGVLIVEDPKQLLSKTLVLNDNACGEGSLFPQALTDLGYAFVETNSIVDFETQLNSGESWDLIIVEEQTNILTTEGLSTLTNQINENAKLFFSYWNWDGGDEQGLLSSLGASSSQSRELPDTINSYAPFPILDEVASLSVIASDDCDAGQANGYSYNADANAKALSGYTDAGNDDEAALVLANNNKTLLFGAQTRFGANPSNNSDSQGLRLAKNVVNFFRPVFAYAVDDTNRIYRVDLKTGEEVIYGSISLPTANRSWHAMTLGPNGYAYAIDSNQWTLATINEDNFNVSLHNINELNESSGIPSLAFDGSHFWIALDNGLLFSIDSSTYTATTIGAGLEPDLISMAWDGENLYGLSFRQGELYRINRADGTTELIAESLPDRKNWSLSADVFGQLWAISEEGEVYTLNKTTGESILINTISSNKFIGFAIKQALQPQVNIAAIDNEVKEFETVILDGSGSTLTETSEFISWQQIAGPAVELLDPDTLNQTNELTRVLFTAPEVTPDNEELEFKLTIHDGKGNIDSEKISVLINNIQVNPVALATAGNNNVADEKTQIILDGSASSDPNGQIVSYVWTQTEGPTAEIIPDASLGEAFLRIRTPEVLERETIKFVLEVTDNDDHKGSTELSIDVVNVVNQEFKVEAGVLETFDEGAAVTLTAIVSPKDESFTFNWTQTQGSTVELQGANTDTLTFTAPEVALLGEELEFSILVTGRGNRRAEDSVTVKIENTIVPPTVSVTGIETTEEKTSVTLTATGEDFDGEPLTYRWELTGGAIVSEMSGQETNELTFTAPEVGLNGEVVSFTVTVTDEDGATDSETWQVNITDVSGTRSVSNPTDAGGGGGSSSPAFLLMLVLLLLRGSRKNTINSKP